MAPRYVSPATRAARIPEEDRFSVARLLINRAGPVASADQLRSLVTALRSVAADAVAQEVRVLVDAGSLDDLARLPEAIASTADLPRGIDPVLTGVCMSLDLPDGAISGGWSFFLPPDVISAHTARVSAQAGLAPPDARPVAPDDPLADALAQAFAGQ